ncbi:carbonic anhydrase [Streptomyces sp. NBRC 110611]|uniref:carbonic anhydrase n=1 Tax=Streptomyces sp. NBRC 110611 TaxID=1621259 RepID=UPI00082A3293|nr:carbonic anhydrase family protein [Streptomyces sp. NBRC 110611]GAU65701.1 carbonic anhydrase [Streptomyces sp. NBRC 110611]
MSNYSAAAGAFTALAALTLASALAAGTRTTDDGPQPSATASRTPHGLTTDDGNANKDKAAGTRWSYEGADGPEKWGDLDPSFTQCKAGRRQSPIDLTKNSATTHPAEVSIGYRPATVTLENRGHTIQATAPGGGTLRVGGSRYELRQFHFHLPSEHTVQGKGTAIELHFVHRNARGQLAVLAVLMRERPGESAFAPLWRALPAAKGGTTTTDRPLDLNRLLPRGRAYFQYAGSLTTPPCTEGVVWTVLAQPVTVSPGEAARYRTLFPLSNRPVQPRRDRALYSSER